MGLLQDIAKLAARAAKEKGKKASKHYCPSSENHRHHMTRHRNTDLPAEHHAGERVHGVTHITYCKDCGWWNHKS